MYRVRACAEDGRWVEGRPSAPVAVAAGGWFEQEDLALLTAVEASQRGYPHVAVDTEAGEWLRIDSGRLTGDVRWARILADVGPDTMVAVLTNQVAERLGVR